MARLSALLTVVIAGQVSAQRSLIPPELRRVWADSTTDVSGRASRDGRFLTFIDWSSYDIDIRDLVSGQSRRVVATQANGSAEPISMVLSPNGKEVAYTVATTDSLSTISVISIQGGSARVIHRGPSIYTQLFGWTPDGRGVIAARSRKDATQTELGVVSLGDGKFQSVAAGQGIRGATLSPDGRFIVFEIWSAQNPTVHDLRIVPSEGGTARVFLSGANDWSPQWTPDGRGVLFVSDRGGGRGLWYEAVSHGSPVGRPRRLVSLNADMTILGVSDSGTVFLGDEGQGLTTYVADVRWPGGIVEHPIPLQTPKFRDARRAVFSPDSRRLAYMLKPRSYATRPGWLTPTVGALTGDSARMFPTRLTLRDAPEWYPDGTALLFVVDAAGSGEGSGPPWTFWRLDLKDGTYRQVGEAPSQGLVRVVGLNKHDFIYKKSDYNRRPVVSAIEAVELKTGATRELYRTTGDIIANAALSNAGDQIAMAVTDTARRSTLFVLTAGEAPKAIAHLRTLNARAQLMWFADDKAILISGQIGADQGLWRVPIDGAAPQKVQVDASQMTEARLSPDGTHLAYTVRGKEPSEVWALDHIFQVIRRGNTPRISRRPYNDR